MRTTLVSLRYYLSFNATVLHGLIISRGQSRCRLRATILQCLCKVIFTHANGKHNIGRHFEANSVPTVCWHSCKKGFATMLTLQASNAACVCVTLTWNRRREWWPRPERWWRPTPGRIGWVGRSGKERRWPRHLARLPQRWNLAWQEEGEKGGGVCGGSGLLPVC